MKKQFIPYIKVFLFILISYLLSSLIIAGAMSLIQFSYHSYHLLICIISYLIIISASFIFFKLNKEKALINASIFALIYALLLSILFIQHWHLSLLLKPLLFLFLNIILIYAKKKQH